jgi:O-antigen ligase
LFAAFIFGILLVVAQMTAIRGEGSVGILDILLVAGAFLAGASTVISASTRQMSQTTVRGNGRSVIGLAMSHPVGFYGIWSALAIAVTFLINAQSGTARIDDLTRASLPFWATSVVIICFMVVVFGRSKSALQAGFVVGSLGAGLVYVVGFLAGVPSMMLEARFTGLAANPNQIAIQALATLLVLATVIVQTRSKIMLYATVAAIPLTLIYGLASRSDAFVICVFPVFGVFLSIAMTRYRIKPALVVAVGLFLAIAFFLSLAAAMPTVFGNLASIVSGQLTQGGQDSVRTILWENGVAAWQYSPFFGNGSGGWSGLGGPFQGMEAHNSIIDWLTITGIFGLLPIFFILRHPFTISDGFKLTRILGLLSLTMFTLFHFVFRLPIFWLAIAMIMIPFDVRFHKRPSK